MRWGQSLRLKAARGVGAGGVPVLALPARDNSHGWVLGKTCYIVGIILAGQTAVDGLAEQRDQVVADVGTAPAFLKIVAGDMGKTQDMIQLSKGQESGVGSDGEAVKFEADFGVEVEP